MQSQTTILLPVHELLKLGPSKGKIHSCPLDAGYQHNARKTGSRLSGWGWVGGAIGTGGGVSVCSRMGRPHEWGIVSVGQLGGEKAGRGGRGGVRANVILKSTGPATHGEMKRTDQRSIATG